MTEFLIALGSLLVGAGASLLIGRFWFLQGFQLGRDAAALDPGETTGSEAVTEATDVLPAVGQSSGRHARIDWPTEDAQAERFVPGGWVRPEVRA